MKALFATSELFPYNKTGGLGDVCACLPQSIKKAGVDIRYLIPAFPSIIDAFEGLEKICSLGPRFRAADISIYKGKIQGNPVPFYLIDAPELFLRGGNPYADAAGNGWSDNHLRFACFSWIAAEFTKGDIDGFLPDVLHLNDWMTALAPAYVELLRRQGVDVRTSTVLTIHNLAFQGIYPYERFADLGLPGYFFNERGVEFYRQISFLKAGISFADKITTVSPTYAAEIQTQAYGCGLEHDLIRRSDRLTGIINGIDYNLWNPATDRHIARNYTVKDREVGKAANKEALQAKLGLAKNARIPLFSVLSRLTEQKGMDILIEAVPVMMMNNIQLVVMGADQGGYMPRFKAFESQYPGQFKVVDFNERESHLIIAGADVLINPARFEPCGLTQMFAMKYGTIPFARKTGGLVDTIIDANFQNTVVGESATGFLFENYSLHDFVYGINRILGMYRNEKKTWGNIMKSAMAQNFSWDKSAATYIDIYNTQLELS